MIFNMESERKLSGVSRTFVLKNGQPLGFVKSLDSKTKTCTRLTPEGVPYEDTFDVLAIEAPKGIPDDLKHLVPPEAWVCQGPTIDVLHDILWM
jgi:hypothetical protein